MLELLQLIPTDIVLEIGTGPDTSPLFSQNSPRKYSPSNATVPSLPTRATVLAAMGYANVHVFTGDGTLGLPPLTLPSTPSLSPLPLSMFPPLCSLNSAKADAWSSPSAPSSPNNSNSFA